MERSDFCAERHSAFVRGVTGGAELSGAATLVSRGAGSVSCSGACAGVRSGHGQRRGGHSGGQDFLFESEG